jgi:hypothetical protein
LIALFFVFDGPPDRIAKAAEIIFGILIALSACYFPARRPAQRLGEWSRRLGVLDLAPFTAAEGRQGGDGGNLRGLTFFGQTLASLGAQEFVQPDVGIGHSGASLKD